MYLSANKYVSRNDYSGDTIAIRPEFQALIDQFDVANVVDPDGFAGATIEFPVGYWRKANQIHAWFVKNVQGGEDNCGTYAVAREQLEELKEICINVLAVPEMAMELLPPQAGFFFGSTEIDEWYLLDIQNTINIIDRCLNSDFDYFTYSSSW